MWSRVLFYNSGYGPCRSVHPVGVQVVHVGNMYKTVSAYDAHAAFGVAVLLFEMHLKLANRGFGLDCADTVVKHGSP